MKTSLHQKMRSASQKAGIQLQQGKSFFHYLMDDFANELKEYNKTGARNYVTIKVKDYAAKKGRNPNTGEVINIPAHKKVKGFIGNFFQKIVKNDL